MTKLRAEPCMSSCPSRSDGYKKEGALLDRWAHCRDTDGTAIGGCGINKGHPWEVTFSCSWRLRHKKSLVEVEGEMWFTLASLVQFSTSALIVAWLNGLEMNSWIFFNITHLHAFNHIIKLTNQLSQPCAWWCYLTDVVVTLEPKERPLSQKINHSLPFVYKKVALPIKKKKCRRWVGHGRGEF